MGDPPFSTSYRETLSSPVARPTLWFRRLECGLHAISFEVHLPVFYVAPIVDVALRTCIIALEHPRSHLYCVLGGRRIPGSDGMLRAHVAGNIGRQLVFEDTWLRGGAMIFIIYFVIIIII